MPELLSAAQVARIFGRSERTIRNWVRAGHLRPVRVGRSAFFRADDIHALLDAASHPALPQSGRPPGWRSTEPHRRGRSPGRSLEPPISSKLLAVSYP